MLNRIVFTNGAVFDYEEIVCHMPLNRKQLREEVEKKLTDAGEEARIVHFDSASQKELMLFMRRGYTFGIMQLWVLEGICETADYDEEMEKNGVIRDWLATEIE